MKWGKLSGEMKGAVADAVNSKGRGKRVEASEHVLKTYHESFLYGKVAPSVKVRGALRAGWLGLFWYFLEFVLSVASGVLYVYSTYKDFNKVNWASRAQNYISMLFAIDYVLRVYSESARLYYMFSIWGLIDLFSALPIIFFARSANRNGQFLKLLQFLRIIRIISLMSKLGVVGSTVLQRILLLVTSTFGAVFLIAGILQYVEYHGAPASRRAECPEEGCINFWDAIYFIIVTISTVGYGEVTPKTALGRVVAMCTIIAALTIIPLQIGKITFLASRRPYGGSFNERKIIDSRYLILSGSISFQAVQEYLAEFYNPTHCQDLEVYPLRVTILAPFRPSFELKQLLSLYHGLVEFIEGSPMRQADLDRVSAMRASAFFLLADRDAEDSGVEDAAQIVKALAVHRFCNHGDIRIIVEVLEPETEASAVWDLTEKLGIEVICPIKYHFRMIARSCMVKGLYTFITNLFTSEIKMKSLREDSFVSEYFHSFDNEVYPLIFPKACWGMLFEEVVEFVFENYNVVLFALDVDVIDQEKHQRVRKVFLHPKGHVIDGDDVGLVICWDLGSAYSISKFEDLETKRWKKKRLSAVELQKYRTGPIVDEAEELSPAAQRMADTALNADTIESRMKAISRRRFTDGSRHGMDDTLESGYGRSLSHGSDDGDGGEYPRGMSVESATETLLAWPPLGAGHAQPHASVLERRQDVILQNLRERTVAVVALPVAHILVCCQSRWPDNIFYLVKELRKPDQSNLPIVIVHPSEPTAVQWGKVGIFEDVFFLKGSPIYELDLMRGGVLQAGPPPTLCTVMYFELKPWLSFCADGCLDHPSWSRHPASRCMDGCAERVVILGFHDAAMELSGELGAEDTSRAQRSAPSVQRSDVDNIVIAANVERLVGMDAGVMIVDMQNTFALPYLRPKFEIQKKHVVKSDYRRNPDALVHFGPPYMEGKAVSLALLGFLLRSSFYNKNTVAMVEQLIDGGHAMRGGAVSAQRPRRLRQIAVPPEYVNKEYGALFGGLLRGSHAGILALGLYRARGTLGSPTAYVFTNPLKTTVVHAADLVYVIS